MQFVIKGMKYNTENMEEVAEVRKWYRVNNFLFQRHVSWKRDWPGVPV